MNGTTPPDPSAAVAPACSSTLSQAQADEALTRIAGVLPRTKFMAAWPACVPGLVALRLEDGSVAYTDSNGRYLLLGLILDTKSGTPLDRNLDGTRK